MTEPRSMAETVMRLAGLMRSVAQQEREPEADSPDTLTAASAFRRMEVLLGITAHELKTPLASGALAVHLAARQLDALLVELAARDAALDSRIASLQRLLRQASDSLERLKRLAGDLTEMLGSRASIVPVRPAAIDLIVVVRAAVEEQRQLTPGRDIRLLVPSRPLAPVLADVDRIRQVVANYLMNAVRYAPADQPIEVSVRRRRNWVHVAVRDEGPGVPSHEQQYIWERFHRGEGLDVATGRSDNTDPGLGLGLHIAKTIVERHQGRVGLRTAPGKGSTFWFSLPLASALPQALRGGGPLPSAHEPVALSGASVHSP